MADLNLRIVRADVKDLAVAIGAEDLEQADDRVGNVAEGSGLSAVPVHRNAFASDSGDHESRDHAPIVEPDTGPENIEGTRNLHGQVVDLRVIYAESLTHPLWLVIAGAGAGTRDVPEILLGGGDEAGVWISIDLAG